jgi:hypothetical protein
MPVPHRSTEPARPRHRRNDFVHLTHWLICAQLLATTEPLEDGLDRGRRTTAALHLEPSHPIKLHQLGRALEDEARACAEINQ